MNREMKIALNDNTAVSMLSQYKVPADIVDRIQQRDLALQDKIADQAKRISADEYEFRNQKMNRNRELRHALYVNNIPMSTWKQVVDAYEHGAMITHAGQEHGIGQPLCMRLVQLSDLRGMHEARKQYDRKVDLQVEHKKKAKKHVRERHGRSLEHNKHSGRPKMKHIGIEI